MSKFNFAADFAASELEFWADERFDAFLASDLVNSRRAVEQEFYAGESLNAWNQL